MKNVVIKRILAFILDMFIVGFISSLIAYPFIDKSNNDKIYNNIISINNEYIDDNNIDYSSYFKEVSGLYYQISKTNSIEVFFNIVISIICFIVIPIYNNGSSLGMKVLGIKIKSKNKQLTSNQLVVRSLINYYILLNILNILFLIVINKDYYYLVIMIFNAIQMIIMIVSLMMIIFNKDKLGIHDKLTNTYVE